MSNYKIPSETVPGHINLTVSNLERSRRFYRDILGFSETFRIGDHAVFLAAGDYHHHLALNTWSGEGAPPPPPGTTGLYHIAFRLPSRRDLGRLLQRLVELKVEIEGTADHGVSQAIYLRDPDGHGLEFYIDRPRSEWPVGEGRLVMYTRPLDIEGLLKESREELH